MRPTTLLTSLSLAIFFVPWHGLSNEPGRPGEEFRTGGLPAEVQQRLQDLPPTALVETVREEHWEGPVYEVTSVDGEVRQVAEDATIVNKPLNGATGLRLELDRQREIEFEELPELVQRAVRKEMGAVEIARVRRGHWSGPVYRIDYVDRGRPEQLRVTAEGTVMQNAFADDQIEFQRMAQRTDASETLELPAPVQETIRQRAGDAPLEEIRAGRIDNARVYLISFTEGDARITLLLNEEGRVLTESAQARASVAAAVPQVPGAQAPTARHEIPPQVRQSIRELTPPGEVAIVTPGSRHGRLFYRVEFLDNGEREVWLDQEGAPFAAAPGEPIREPAAAAPNEAGEVAPFYPHLVHLPPAVRETLAALQVEQVHSASWTTGPQGGIIYRLQISHQGRHGEIQVRDDGYLLP